MSKLRKKAIIRLILCLLALVASIAFSVFLLTGKDSTVSAPESAASDSAESVSTDSAESVSDSTESTDTAQSTDPAAESVDSTVDSGAEETPAPDDTAEPTTFDGLSEQPTTVFSEGDRLSYTTPSDSNMNLRPSPSTDGDPVAKVPAGTSVTALGTNADGTWIVVEYNGQYGWLMMDFLTQQ